VIGTMFEAPQPKSGQQDLGGTGGRSARVADERHHDSNVRSELRERS
jgi:hypothetical protein